MVSVGKTSADGTDEGLMPDQSSATPGRQSVGLLAGTARFMKRAVTTADRYKQFIDADVDTEVAPITSSDCEADSQSDGSSEPKPPHQLDFQYAESDDTSGHQSTKLSLPHVFTAVTTSHTSTSAEQPVVQARKFSADDGNDKCRVRHRPAKPDFAVHASTANPFSLGKIQLPMSHDASASAGANCAPFCHEKMDVFGAAPFHRKVAGPMDGGMELADTMAEPDVFANVPFVRQQEKVAKAEVAVSPPATSKVGCLPNPALSSDVSSYNTFPSSESSNTGSLCITSSAGFNQSLGGPTLVSFVPAEPVSSGHIHFVDTLPSAIQLHSVEAQEMGVYAQQDGGPLLASLPVSVAGVECLDQHSCTSKSAMHLPVLTPEATQAQELQTNEEGHGSLKRSWLAKLRNDKESPTTAVANLGFSDDPDAIVLSSGLSSASDLSFHGHVLDVVAEPKSPAVTSESNFLLPSGEGSHTLPKVGAKKHLPHPHHIPLMPPETESFSVTKKGIALL